MIDAEAFAISEALNTVATRKPPLGEIFIFSDSQAAIRQFQNGTSSVAEKAKTVACDLSNQGYILHLQWCPSHCGIPGNEFADLLAKRALKKAPSSQQASISFIKRNVKSNTLNEWRKQWEVRH